MSISSFSQFQILFPEISLLQKHLINYSDKFNVQSISKGQPSLNFLFDLHNICTEEVHCNYRQALQSKFFHSLYIRNCYPAFPSPSFSLLQFLPSCYRLLVDFSSSPGEVIFLRIPGKRRGFKEGSIQPFREDPRNNRNY